MKIYSVPITLHATAYVKATSGENALSKANQIAQSSLEIIGDSLDLFSGLTFDDPRLPEISLSPALTIGNVANQVLVEEVDL